MLEVLWQDLKYAARSLTHTPAFTAAAIVTLALGIGANTAIFSLVQAVMLRPLPVNAPGELYFIAHGVGDQMSTASNYPWFERLQQRSDVFAGVAAYNIRNFKVSSDAGLEQVVGQYVSGNYHRVLGVPFALGRGFSTENDRAAGTSPFAVISHDYWTQRFNRAPEAIGSTLIVGGHPVTIVGVTAPEFAGAQPGRSIAITLPVSIRIEEEPDFVSWTDTWTSMPLFVRLNPGVSRVAAQAALDSAFRTHMSQPDQQRFARMPDGQPRAAYLTPGARGLDRLRRDYGTPLRVLMAMVGLVLLIACVNVANLLLVRAAPRAPEIAIRMSVGATRWRLVRQLLTESVLLSICGGALGLFLAAWGTRFVSAIFRASQNPMVIDAQPDATVLVFTAILSMLTALAFGMAPAFRASRIDVAPALKQGQSNTGARGFSAGRRALVAVQIATCLVLVFGAGLLVRTLRNLQGVDGGFENRNVLVFALDARDTTFPAERVSMLCGDLLDRLRSRAGVISGSCSTMTPLDTSFEGRVIGLPAAIRGRADQIVYANTVTPDYFGTFGIDLVRGRLFTAQDIASSTRVAIVNEAVAKAYFGDIDPTGRTIVFGGRPDPSRALTIVGVVKDARQFLRDDAPLMTYQPLAQIVEPPRDLTVALRTSVDPSLLAAQAQSDLRALTRDVAVTWVRTMRQQIAAALTTERLLATLSSTFAALALLLSAIGLYGVMSYDVSRRTRDIGIRLALGAERRMVVGSVLRQTAIIAGAGLTAGVVAAMFGARVVSRFLFGLEPGDPNTLMIATGTLAITAMLAGYFPARRAARVDPATALRAE